MSLLADLTHPDVGALNRDRTVAVVPVGAIEQHGPHLPFDTDAFLVTAVAQEAASRVSDDGPVLVTPTLPVGSSEHHMAFPGTLTLASDTFLRMVTEVCRSLHRHGFRRQVVINGHGGNTALLAEAVRQLAFEATATSPPTAGHDGRSGTAGMRCATYRSSAAGPGGAVRHSRVRGGGPTARSWRWPGGGPTSRCASIWTPR